MNKMNLPKTIECFNKYEMHDNTTHITYYDHTFLFKELIDNIKYVAESYNLLNADFLLALKAINDDIRALFRKQHRFYANVDGNIIYVEKKRYDGDNFFYFVGVIIVWKS